jgi:DNA processing protein
MVGSRNASAAGLAMTERLARGLGAQGYCIVSGLARGVDGRAHRSSLATGTIAVLAGGQDRLYPAEHTELAEQIVERGAILSEMPMGWEARGRDFPRRNRIVAGLSLATVVVEAARKSGSLITANFANEQGRIVMAVPGHPLDPRSEGPNDLLAEGASICRGIEDVLAAVSPLARTGQGDLFREPSYAEPGTAFWDELDLGLGESPAPPLAPLPPTGGVPPAPAPGEAAAGIRERLASLLGTTPVPLDDLIRQSGAPAAQVRPIILEMELAGQITRLDGGRIALLIR